MTHKKPHILRRGGVWVVIAHLDERKWPWPVTLLTFRGTIRDLAADAHSWPNRHNKS